MSLPLETFALAALIVIAAYVIFGLTGLGSTMVRAVYSALVVAGVSLPARGAS